MTEDRGMDCEPSWQELKAERDVARRDYEVMNKLREGAEAERDELKERCEALEAHVEYLTSLGRELRSEEDDERAAVLAEWSDSAIEDAPTTSLARLKEDIRGEVWNEINGPVSASGEPIIPAPPPLEERALRLCYAIEEAGASETLTEASVLASELLAVLRRQAEGGEYPPPSPRPPAPHC